MATNARLRDKSPLLTAFGEHHEFLGIDEEVGADVATRLTAIWPFLVRKALAFQKTLKPRERVYFDVKDTLAEPWATLTEKDGHWSPERGRYISYAGALVDRELYAIRDKARTVHAPRNSSWRLGKYRAAEAEGTLTGRQRRTADDIRRTSKAAGSVSARGAADDDCFTEPMTTTDDPLAALVAKEKAELRRAGLREAMEHLIPSDAEVLTRLCGLDGADAISVRQLALEFGRGEVEIRRAKERAMSKVRKFLVASRHPAMCERN